MKAVELYRKVCLACQDGTNARAAVRNLGMSRESVKKMLCFSVPPGCRRSAPVRRPKLVGFTEIIDHWLREDLMRTRKRRHTEKRIQARWDGVEHLLEDEAAGTRDAHPRPRRNRCRRALARPTTPAMKAR